MLTTVVMTGVLVTAGASPGSTRPLWSVVPTPNPAGSQHSSLSGIACPHPNSCFAVGGSLSSASRQRGLIEHWNGRTWRIVTTSPDTSRATDLHGVACPTTGSCFVVGEHSTAAHPTRAAFVEHWNGSHWSVMTAPNPRDATGVAVLRAVACPLPMSCFAAGAYVTAEGTRSLIEHWNGRHWGIMARPGGAVANADTALAGVSCPDARFCFAVGTYATSNFPKPLIESWDGRQWGIDPNPVPSGSGVATLNGVACVFTSNCFAVGTRKLGPVTKSLVQHWNGHHWGIMAAPNPAANNVGMSGVACPSARSCFAVGSGETSASTKTLIEHWNGRTWQIMPSADPVGATSAEMTAVACGRLRSCAAVGDRFTTNMSSLAEHYS